MTESPPVKVLSLESDQSIRASIRVLLDGVSDLTLSAEAETVQQARCILDKGGIDLALIDLAEPGSIEFIAEIRDKCKAIKVAVVTASDEPGDIFSAMDAGADAYVLKANLKESLENAIRCARLAEVWLDPALARQVLQVIEDSTTSKGSRVLPTGLMILPLLPEDKSLLEQVASSHQCEGGVCMVDASFLKKLRRYGP
ncbi:MAG: response regulator [Cyanobacteriota/Melainabacteria group bacterium]